MDERRAARAFAGLVQLTRHLRSEDGCAWDREQTIESVRPHFVEELHEVLEALDQRDDGRLLDELGDLLFLIVFIARIAEEQARFDIKDVLASIDDKLRRRHPHVFGGEAAATADEVRTTWESIKLREDGHASRESILDGLPRELSALLTARRMQEKASAIGFDWDDVADVLGKAEEELAELRSEITSGMTARYEEELGDLLFAVVNVARFLDIDPDAALRRANLKFRTRFAEIERRFQGRDLRDVGLAAMDRVWNEAKELEEGD